MTCLQAAYFDQNFSSTFFLHPEEAGLPVSSAAASASKGLQRLKRTSLPLPEAQSSRECGTGSDRGLHHTRQRSEQQQTERGSQQEVMPLHNAEPQQDIRQAIPEPHKQADGQQHEEMQLERHVQEHEKEFAFHGHAEEQTEGNEMPAFSLDRYFLPHNRKANSQAQHSNLGSPAKNKLFQSSPQQFGGPAMQPSHANADYKDIEEELLTTIEEQNEALG